jgi:hypothetical protein
MVDKTVLDELESIFDSLAVIRSKMKMAEEELTDKPTSTEIQDVVNGTEKSLKSIDRKSVV